MQNFSDTLGQVFRAMMANKLRTFLTMFGIAWGVGSLLVLVGLGEGFRSGQHRNLATFGNDVVMMWNGTIPAVANQHTGMRPYQLTLRDEADLWGGLPLWQVEKRAVEATLKRTGGNISEAATLLQIDRSTLYEKIKRYGIPR